MIGLALALFTIGAAHAQAKQQRTPDDRAKRQTERMTEELGLNADQATRVEAINAKYAEKGQAMRIEHKEKMADMKGKGAELHDARMADMKAVLTTEQYAKWEKNMEAMKEKRVEKRKQLKADDRQ